MSTPLDDDEARVISEIDGLSEEIVQLAADLIRIPSTNPTLAEDPKAATGGEGRCARLVGEALADDGLQVTVVEVAPGRANVVGTLRGEGGGRSLALNGHVDTVPAPAPEEWSVDPYGGLVRDGRLWGRGATDMKGAVAAMAKAATAVKRAGVPLRGDLCVHVVVGEEMFDPEGTGAVLAAGHTPEACIVGEPSRDPGEAGPAVQVISAPVLWMRVTLRGRSAHSSLRYQWIHPGGDPDLGVNAIEKAVDLVKVIQELERLWGLRKQHPLFPPGKFVLHPGIFHGAPEGVSMPGLPAERCVVEYIIWHHPEEAAEDVQHEIEDWIGRWAGFDPWLADHPPEIDWLGVYPNFAVDPEAEIVRIVSEAHETLVGEPPKVTSMPAACDATFYSQRDIPALVYGPGDLRIAHTVDESIEVEELVLAAKVYALAAVRWCR